MKKRILISVLLIIIIIIVYEICGLILTRSCISRAVALKEGLETIEDTNDPLWSAQYREGSHDSSSVKVTVIPLFFLFDANKAKSHMLVLYKYYDEEGRVIMKSAPENETFFYKKINGKWTLERIFRRA